MTKGCERYGLMIHGYLDGELTLDEQGKLREHIASCERCASALEEIRSMMADLDRLSLHFDDVHVWDEVRARVLPPMATKKNAYVFPIALVATMVIYKVMDVTAGFGVAVLLKPVVLLAVTVLLVWNKQNPFRLLETLNEGSSATRN